MKIFFINFKQYLYLAELFYTDLDLAYNNTKQNGV